MSLLELRDLSVDFGRRRVKVLDRVSLDVEAGERLGLVGASGSGKTVLATALMGLLPDNAHVQGSIVYRGTDLTTIGDKEYSRIRGRDLTMVFQEPLTALDPTMKVGRQAAELIALHRDGNPMATRDRVEQVFDRVGLDQASQVADAYPHELSGGQRQRVIIAMGLINRPGLVICDEPTTALDATVQAQVLNLLDAELTASHSACLFISHDLTLVSRMCQRMAIIHAGRIVEEGRTAEVMARPQHPYTRGLLATARIDQVPPGEPLPVIEDFYREAEDGR